MEEEYIIVNGKKYYADNIFCKKCYGIVKDNIKSKVEELYFKINVSGNYVDGKNWAFTFYLEDSAKACTYNSNAYTQKSIECINGLIYAVYTTPIGDFTYVSNTSSMYPERYSVQIQNENKLQEIIDSILSEDNETIYL